MTVRRPPTMRIARFGRLTAPALTLATLTVTIAVNVARVAAARLSSCSPARRAGAYAPGSSLGGRPMAGLLVLVQAIGVRIPAPQLVLGASCPGPLRDLEAWRGFVGRLVGLGHRPRFRPFEVVVQTAAQAPVVGQ